MHQSHPQDGSRAQWMSVLAKATADEVEALHGQFGPLPPFVLLRPPESGLVMLRGRAGGDGAAFNLGEMTVTRCSLRLTDGAVGHAYVAGRNHRHALLAAVFDALLQDRGRRPALWADLIAPLAARQADRKAIAASKAGATKVDFFTMARGED